MVQSVGLDEFRIEAFVFIANDFFPWFVYFLDLPLIFIILLTANRIEWSIPKFLIVVIWFSQPSYDSTFIILMIFVSSSYLFFKYIAILLAAFIKLEMFAVSLLVKKLHTFYGRIKLNAVFYCCIFVLVAIVFIFNMNFPLAAIDPIQSASFSGERLAVVRLLGYLAMPVSAILAIDVGAGVSSNWIRMQVLLSVIVLFLSMRTWSFLWLWFFISVFVALAVNFYQARYVIVIVFSVMLLQTNSRGRAK